MQARPTVKSRPAQRPQISPEARRAGGFQPGSLVPPDCLVATALARRNVARCMPFACAARILCLLPTAGILPGAALRAICGSKEEAPQRELSPWGPGTVESECLLGIFEVGIWQEDSPLPPPPIHESHLVICEPITPFLCHTLRNKTVERLLCVRGVVVW